MVNLQGKDNHIDGYIDNLLTIILDSPSLIPRGIHVVPLVCYVFFRPVHPNKPIKQFNIISNKKLKAEGNLAKTKTFLGWIINTREMKVFLPSLKDLNWINEIDDTLSLDKVNFQSLEKLIGKLNHAAFKIPFSRFFLNRLRRAMQLAKKHGPQRLPSSTKEDLELFKNFLSRMSTNCAPFANITHSLPDLFCWSDACSYWMGGFNNE